MTRLAPILIRQGHFPEAEKVERDALVRERRALGADDPLTLRTMDCRTVELGIRCYIS
jgi:hypothetical protein